MGSRHADVRNLYVVVNRAAQTKLIEPEVKHMDHFGGHRVDRLKNHVVLTCVEIKLPLAIWQVELHHIEQC